MRKMGPSIHSAFIFSIYPACAINKVPGRDMNETFVPVLMELIAQWGREALNSNNRNPKYMVFQIVIIVI